MPAVDYRTLAGDILEKVGGESNVASLAHCATRLRFRLKDASKADKAGVERLPGVITVMEAGGQFQVVIGNNVPLVFAEVGKLSSLTGDTEEADAGPKGNLLNRFVALISAIFLPFLWTLAARRCSRRSSAPRPTSGGSTRRATATPSSTPPATRC